MKAFLSFLACLFIALPADAQLFAEASRTLREADHARLVFGDLDRAATLYRDVSESPSASRADVARALFSLAEVTEISDPDEAAEIYTRITTEFPDVSDVFQAARESLGTLGSDAQVVVRDYSLVMEEMPPTNIERMRHFAVSPDGRRLAVVAPTTDARLASYPDLNREIYVMDIDRGTRRPLVVDPGNLAWMNDPRWSPDGRLVAFRGLTPDVTAVIVANVVTGEARRFDGAGWQSNRAPIWMPDSESLLLSQGEKLAIRSVDGDLLREIPFENGMPADFQPGGVSPNGQHLLYHARSENSELNSETDIWVMDLVTGMHRQVTTDAGPEGHPFWNADGTAFFFTAGTEHVRNIVRQTFDSRAEREQITSYRNARATHPVYLPRAGKLAFVLATEGSTVVRAVDGAPEPLVRGSMAQLSPDGETVFYLDSEPGREGLWAARLDGSWVHQLAAGQISASYVEPQYVSPDGQQVAFTRHEGDETAIYTMSASGGPATERFRTPGQFYTQPFWSPDGSRIAFSKDGDMYVIELTSGKQRLLASTEYWEGWSLNWSPDGSLITAFARGAEGGDALDVILVDAETGSMRDITPPDQPYYKEGLDWHPDGKRITYMYYGRGDDAWGGDGSEILDIESGEVRTLVDTDEYWDYIGLWGPDGNYYFSTSPPGFGNEWMLYRHTPGTQHTEATAIDDTAEHQHGLPSFSRDGSVMIYSKGTYNNQLWTVDGVN